MDGWPEFDHDRKSKNPTRRRLLKEQDQLNVKMHHATFQALNYSSANRIKAFFEDAANKEGLWDVLEL